MKWVFVVSGGSGVDGVLLGRCWSAAEALPAVAGALLGRSGTLLGGWVRCGAVLCYAGRYCEVLCGAVRHLTPQSPINAAQAAPCNAPAAPATPEPQEPTNTLLDAIINPFTRE